MYVINVPSAQTLILTGPEGGTYTGPVVVLANELTYQESVIPAAWMVADYDMNVYAVPVTQASAGIIAVGRFAYLGFSIFNTGGSIASFTLSDSMAGVVDYVAVAIGMVSQSFHPEVIGPDNVPYSGIVIEGNLTMGTVVGTFTGIIRVTDQ
jgi:hypothetical protein